MAKHSTDILDLAKRGAEVRLRELAQEAHNLLEMFPHLRDAFDKDELPIPFIIAKGSGQLTSSGAGGGSRRRSASTRKAMSERMKKAWEQRKAKAPGRKPST